MFVSFACVTHCSPSLSHYSFLFEIALLRLHTSKERSITKCGDNVATRQHHLHSPVLQQVQLRPVRVGPAATQCVFVGGGGGGVTVRLYVCACVCVCVSVGVRIDTRMVQIGASAIEVE